MLCASLRLGRHFPIFHTYTSLSSLPVTPILCYSTKPQPPKKHKQTEKSVKFKKASLPVPALPAPVSTATNIEDEDIPEEEEYVSRRKSTVERRELKYGEKVSFKRKTKDKTKKALAIEQLRESRYTQTIVILA